MQHCNGRLGVANRGYGISKGCSAQDSIGNKCQTAHLDQIQVLAYDHEMSATENSKLTTHGSVVITKNLDKSSPLLSQAVDRREKVKYVIDMYRVDASGSREKFYTVELRNAVITHMESSSPHAVLESEREHEERIAISYRDIIWTHHAAGTSGYASWDGSH